MIFEGFRNPGFDEGNSAGKEELTEKGASGLLSLLEKLEEKQHELQAQGDSPGEAEESLSDEDGPFAVLVNEVAQSLISESGPAASGDKKEFARSQVREFVLGHINAGGLNNPGEAIPEGDLNILIDSTVATLKDKGFVITQE